MASVELRPPLPPALPHKEVAFVLPRGNLLSPELVAAIAAALAEALPNGDFVAHPDGSLLFAEPHSPWSLRAREDALERSPSL
jgi:hypothetical protein